MLCLSDNDIILKLAEYDVLDEAIDLLQAERRDVYVLPTAKSVVSKSNSVAAVHTRTAIDRALRFLGTVKTITNADPIEAALLSRVRGIDIGEGTIFAATKNLPAFRIATGDKKSLRALVGCDECHAIYARLKGCVVCLEQLVVLLIRHHGYGWVQKRVGRCVGDACIENAFAGGKSTQTEADCMKWLNDYILDLQKATNDLLLTH